MIKIRKMNFRSISVLIMGMIMIGFNCLILWIWLTTQLDFFLYFSLILILIVLLLLHNGLTKIEISKKYITTKNLFHSRQIMISEIKTIGLYGYSPGSNMVEVIDKERYDKFYFGQKFIFISTKPDFIPYFIKKPKVGYIDFHYRKQIFELLNNNAST